MLVEVSNSVPGLPRVEDMSLWDKVAFLLRTKRFAVSLEDLAAKPVQELSKELHMPIPQVLNLKLILAICEDYHSIKQYRELEATDTAKVAKFFMDQWSHLDYEKVVMLFCDDTRILEVAEWNGKFNEATYDANTVVRTAKAVNAKSIIVIHNHPFGTIKPSAMDFRATKTLIEIGMDQGFEVSEHIIVGKRKHYSFAKQGNLDELIESCKSERMQTAGWD